MAADQVNKNEVMKVYFEEDKGKLKITINNEDCTDKVSDGENITGGNTEGYENFILKKFKEGGYSSVEFKGNGLGGVIGSEVISNLLDDAKDDNLDASKITKFECTNTAKSYYKQLLGNDPENPLKGFYKNICIVPDFLINYTGFVNIEIKKNINTEKNLTSLKKKGINVQLISKHDCNEAVFANRAFHRAEPAWLLSSNNHQDVEHKRDENIMWRLMEWITGVLFMSILYLRPSILLFSLYSITYASVKYIAKKTPRYTWIITIPVGIAFSVVWSVSTCVFDFCKFAVMELYSLLYGLITGIKLLLLAKDEHQNLLSHELSQLNYSGEIPIQMYFNDDMSVWTGTKKAIISLLKNNPEEIERIPKLFYRDKEVMLAVIENGNLVEFGDNAYYSLTNNKYFMLKAAKIDPEAVLCISPNLRRKLSFWRKAVQKNIKVLKFVPEPFYAMDESFSVAIKGNIQAAVSITPFALQHAKDVKVVVCENAKEYKEVEGRYKPKKINLGNRVNKVKDLIQGRKIQIIGLDNYEEEFKNLSLKGDDNKTLADALEDSGIDKLNLEELQMIYLMHSNNDYHPTKEEIAVTFINRKVSQINELLIGLGGNDATLDIEVTFGSGDETPKKQLELTSIRNAANLVADVGESKNIPKTTPTPSEEIISVRDSHQNNTSGNSLGEGSSPGSDPGGDPGRVPRSSSGGR